MVLSSSTKTWRAQLGVAEFLVCTLDAYRMDLVVLSWACKLKCVDGAVGVERAYH
jgi:hypothetical protein